MAASSTMSRRRPHRVAGTPRTARKVSVRLPADVLADIEDRVGPGGVSRYIAETVEDNERRVALRQWLEDFETEHGPITDNEVEEELTRWDAEIRTGGSSTGPSSSTARD